MLNKVSVIIFLSSVVFSVCAEQATGYPGAVSKIDLPLVAETQFNQKQSLKKTFREGDLEGWLSTDSNWYIKGTVTHTRLRCATYSLGIQLGKGNPACLNVKWLTRVSYGTSRKQCNSAPMIHAGGGDMPELANVLKEATCVRVVTRCTGACGKTDN
jgi:hypothetical protein